MGMRANAHLRKRGPEPINAAVERREARLSDRKERRHASHACRVASPATHGAALAPAFLGAPLPSFWGARRKAQASGAIAPRVCERLFEKRIATTEEQSRAAVSPQP
jgi:hypothetical protein